VARILSLLLSVGLLASPLGAQGPRIVRGLVADAARGHPIAGASVTVVAAPSAPLARSGPAGAFVLRVPGGAVRLAAALIGFAPETVTVGAGDDTITIRLRAVALALDPLTVAADPGPSAASSETIRQLDLALRPRASSQDLLRAVPGLVIAQHAGGGKAEQIFLRGFDADHGTDVALSVDGVPVNMVSHAHGQGYADLHWLAPDAVGMIDLRKGPYDAQDGDLATAGAVHLRTLDRVARSEVATGGGSFRTAEARALVAVGGDERRPGGYVAAAARYSDGPFERAQAHRRYAVFGKWTTPVSGSLQLVATAAGSAAAWNASGQIPERAVLQGLITRFGSVDRSEGGRTRRRHLTVGLRAPTGEWEAVAYAVRYDLRLFSNFTFFLRDSVNGDGIEQHDGRWMLGASAHGTRRGTMGGWPTATTVGAGTRADLASVGLFRQRQRARLGAVSDARVSQQHLFLWARQEVQVAPPVRLTLGLRGDLFRFGVGDGLAVTAGGGPAALDVRWASRLSPKANVAVHAADGLVFYGNVGAGFHSNDARVVLASPPDATALPRATGAELGARRTWAGGSVALAAWALDLESELVYVGDEGTTEPSGRTRRAGLDLEGRFRLAPAVWADLDVALARGRFRDLPAGADRIPLAPTVTAAGGLTAGGAGAIAGAVRFRYIGPRWATEGGTVTAPGAAVLDLLAEWRLSRLVVRFSVENVLDALWNEAQFATTSRLRDEVAPVTELHYTPGSPRALQLGLRYGL
jgi:hypothetical protein